MRVAQIWFLLLHGSQSTSGRNLATESSSPQVLLGVIPKTKQNKNKVVYPDLGSSPEISIFRGESIFFGGRGEPHLAVTKVDSQLCAQRSLLVVVRGQYVMSGIEPSLAGLSQAPCLLFYCSGPRWNLSQGQGVITESHMSPPPLSSVFKASISFLCSGYKPQTVPFALELLAMQILPICVRKFDLLFS